MQSIEFCVKGGQALNKVGALSENVSVENRVKITV